jgi:hypothetical protein
MKSFNLGRYALSGGVAVALLTGCGGAGESATPSAGQAAQPLTQSRTFIYINKKQSFVVPAGVTRVTVVARGAGGASCPRTGRGARLYAKIPVTAKERLDIYVGGMGVVAQGGFNGGGGSGDEFGGGGASDVRVSPGKLRDRILVAAGGGGAGGTYQDCIYGVPYGAGGVGGGLTGENGQIGWYYGYGSGRGGSGALRPKAARVAALDRDAKNLAVQERMERSVAGEAAAKTATPVMATTATTAEAAVVRRTLNPALRTSTIGRTGKTRAETV